MAERQKLIERWKIAKDPTTPPSTLSELAENRNLGIRKAIAHNPSTPGHVLDAFAVDQKIATRAAAARNHSSPDTLEVLSKDACLYVRQAVAANPATSCETIMSLANDPSYDVRVQLLKNPSAPPQVWEQMINQLSLRPRRRMACNVPCYQDVVRRLARDPDGGVRYSVGCNSNLDEETVSWLIQNGDFQVIAGISQNYENLPEFARAALEKSIERFGYTLNEDHGSSLTHVSLAELGAAARYRRHAAHREHIGPITSRAEARRGGANHVSSTTLHSGVRQPRPDDLADARWFRRSWARTRLAIAIGIAWLIVGWWVREVDVCLDAGGRWQMWGGHCEGARPADG